ncbi:MAG: D-alanine--D-alanine ligase [Phycisphaerae bacterium]|nr:D-alanine--D-alanine ligase [Phycisphaerae bacterium]
MNPLNITVLHGGPSAEREVSLVSGRAVAEALRGVGHRVSLFDITPDDLSSLDRPDADVVFPVLHGTWGEDGQLQRILEDRGLTYVGSGPEASELAMNKAATKTAFVAAGLPTPGWQVLGEWPGRWDGDFPLVVKPVDEGSSVDLFICRDLEAMRKGVETVCAKHGRCLIEQFIPGRELTVGILEGKSLPPVEIVVSAAHEYYDYQAKYADDGGTRYVVEPDLTRRLRDRMCEIAEGAFEAVGCRDYARIDFRLRPDGRMFLLEVNTIPGFTSHSLLPMAAAASGLDFGALCGRLVELASRRNKRLADAG